MRRFYVGVAMRQKTTGGVAVRKEDKAEVHPLEELRDDVFEMLVPQIWVRPLELQASFQKKVREITLAKALYELACSPATFKLIERPQEVVKMVKNSLERERTMQRLKERILGRMALLYAEAYAASVKRQTQEQPTNGPYYGEALMY